MRENDEDSIIAEMWTGMKSHTHPESPLVSESPLAYRIGVVLAAFSFCVHSFDALLGELLQLGSSSLHTAVSMYVPLLLALCLLSSSDRKVGTRLFETKGFILLCFISGFWLVNYCLEVNSLSDAYLSDYDRKRIWFFFHGVVLSGLLGIYASKSLERFTRLFLPWFCAFTLVSSVLYLLTYRPEQNFERLLGERALGAGLLAAFGVAACFSSLLLRADGRRGLSGRAILALMAVIPVNVSAIALSATRGAALCCLVSVAVFAWMIRRSRQSILVGLLVFLLCGVVQVGRPYLPEATVNRMVMKEQGLDLRYEAAGAIRGLIAENPYGKVFGYESSRLQMDYSHNALLQYVAEAGLQSVPTLIILFCIVIWNLTSYRADVHVRALALFGLPIFMESFSAGAAYNSLLWFLLFFVFSLRENCPRATAFPSRERCMYANGPLVPEDQVVRWRIFDGYPHPHRHSHECSPDR